MSCMEDENASFSRDDTSDTHMRFHTRRHLFVCPRLVYLWCARDLQRDHLAETMAEMTCELLQSCLQKCQTCLSDAR